MAKIILSLFLLIPWTLQSQKIFFADKNQTIEFELDSINMISHFNYNTSRLDTILSYYGNPKMDIVCDEKVEKFLFACYTIDLNVEDDWRELFYYCGIDWQKHRRFIPSILLRINPRLSESDILNIYR
jgi:hypothetical protein